MRELDFVGFDLETTNLSADFSVILSACIKPFGKYPIVFRADEYNKEWFTGDRKNDKNITRAIIKELSKHAIVMGHYMTGFDIPYLNAKTVKYQLPALPNLFVLDTYNLARKNIKISRRRLDALAGYFFGGKKSAVEGELWMKAGIDGDKEALDAIVKHNIQDVILLERLAQSLFMFMKSMRQM